MAGSSGLSEAHRAHARKIIVRGANLMVRNKDRIHYSQRPDRWVGIERKLSCLNGQYPTTADCSSTASWMLWDAMARNYGVRDCVNNLAWKAGWTGSMYKLGLNVQHEPKIGDLVFYGTQAGGVPEHVAVYIGGGLVFSHGSEGGPYILKKDYRGDRRMTRRYI
jgi:NlpC/P60 family